MGFMFRPKGAFICSSSGMLRLGWLVVLWMFGGHNSIRFNFWMSLGAKELDGLFLA